MATGYHIVAISWHVGEYDVIATADFSGVGEVDWPGLDAAHPMTRIREPSAYADLATLVSASELRPFIVGKRAREFVDGTAGKAFVFLIHAAEWESGLGE